MKYINLEDVCEILDSQRVPITASERKSGIYPYYGANGIQDYVEDYIFDDNLVLLAEDGGNFGSRDKPIAYRVSGRCWVNNHAHVLKPKAIVKVSYNIEEMKIVKRGYEISIDYLCHMICAAAAKYYEENKEKFSFINFRLIDKRKEDF